jgi:diguanylate cyclase (GGDEF)-like protein
VAGNGERPIAALESRRNRISAGVRSPRCIHTATERVRELNQILAEANEKLAALASTDGLTGIANRRAFNERLQAEWARAGRRKSLSLVILDLDFFKQYNDHYGHVMGDECLKQVARVLRDQSRNTDLVARIGGEEFSLLLPDTSIEGAMLVAETARSNVAGLRLQHAKSPLGVVTASFGVAAATYVRTKTVRDLMHAADKALYEAKASGRNANLTFGGHEHAPPGNLMREVAFPAIVASRPRRGPLGFLPRSRAA